MDPRQLGGGGLLWWTFSSLSLVWVVLSHWRTLLLLFLVLGVSVTILAVVLTPLLTLLAASSGLFTRSPPAIITGSPWHGLIIKSVGLSTKLQRKLSSILTLAGLPVSLSDATIGNLVISAKWDQISGRIQGVAWHLLIPMVSVRIQELSLCVQPADEIVWAGLGDALQQRLASARVKLGMTLSALAERSSASPGDSISLDENVSEESGTGGDDDSNRRAGGSKVPHLWALLDRLINSILLSVENLHLQVNYRGGNESLVLSIRNIHLASADKAAKGTNPSRPSTRSRLLEIAGLELSFLSVADDCRWPILTIAESRGNVILPDSIYTFANKNNPLMGKFVRIELQGFQGLTAEYRPTHIQWMINCLIDLFQGSVAYQEWVDSCKQQAGDSCRSFRPSAEMVEAYIVHWQKKKRACALDTSLSVCQMLLLRSRASGWTREKPSRMSSRALDAGLIRELDLQNAFEEQDGTISVGAEIYTEDREEASRCNALLYALCNEWVEKYGHFSGLSEFQLSLDVSKLDVLLYEVAATGDESINSLQYAFSCNDIMVNLGILLGVSPSVLPDTGGAGKGGDRPSLLRVLRLAAGAAGQEEGLDIPRLSVQCLVGKFLLTDVGQLQRGDFYPTLVDGSSLSDKGLHISYGSYALRDDTIDVVMEGALAGILVLDRILDFVNLILSGLQVSAPEDDQLNRHGGGGALADEEPDDVDLDGSLESVSVDALPPLLPPFLPEPLGLGVRASLGTVLLALPENFRDPEGSLLVVEAAANAEFSSSEDAEFLSVDLHNLSVLPCIFSTEEGSVGPSNKVKVACRRLAIAARAVSASIPREELEDSSNQDAFQRAISILHSGATYTGLAARVVRTLPLVDPTDMQFHYSMKVTQPEEGLQSKQAHRNGIAKGLLNQGSATGRLPLRAGPSRSMSNHQSGGDDFTADFYGYLCFKVKRVELAALDAQDMLLVDPAVLDAYGGVQLVEIQAGDSVVLTPAGAPFVQEADVYHDEQGEENFGAAYNCNVVLCTQHISMVENVRLTVKTLENDLVIGVAETSGAGCLGKNQALHLHSPLNDGTDIGRIHYSAEFVPAQLLVTILKVKGADKALFLTVEVDDLLGRFVVKGTKSSRSIKTADGYLFPIETRSPVVIIRGTYGEDSVPEHRITFSLRPDMRGTSRLNFGSVQVTMGISLVISHDYAVLPPPEGMSSYPGLPRSYSGNLVLHSLTSAKADAFEGPCKDIHIRLNAPSGFSLLLTDLDTATLVRVLNNLNASLKGNEEIQIGNVELPPERTLILLRRAFEKADVDGNGRLDYHEVEALLRSHLGPALMGGDSLLEEAVQRFMKLADRDSSDEIDVDEFVAVMSSAINDSDSQDLVDKAQRHMLREAFAEFDLDGSGVLEPDEARQVMKTIVTSLTNTELQQGFSSVLAAVGLDDTVPLDEDTFVDVLEAILEGAVRSGPVLARAGEYCSASVKESLLGPACRSVAQLLSSQPPGFELQPFWDVFNREIGDLEKDQLRRQGSMDSISISALEAVGEETTRNRASETQAKLVKAVHNYELARELWSLQVVPKLCDGAPRIGHIKVRNSEASSLPYWQMMLPVCVGEELHIRDDKISGGKLSLSRLPDSLKDVMITGIRTRQADRNCRSSRFLTFVTSSPCRVIVCVHRETGGAHVAPKWLARAGYEVMDGAVEAVYERGGVRRVIQFRAFAASLPAGLVTLGGNEGARYQYFVLVAPAERAIIERSASRTFDAVPNRIAWTLVPTTILRSIGDLRGMQRRAKERTQALRLMSTVASSALRRQATPRVTQHALIRLRLSSLVGPVSIKLQDLYRMQNSDEDSPRLHILLRTLGTALPFTHSCMHPDCKRIVVHRGDESADYEHHMPRFCYEHAMVCAVRTCEDIAIYCMEGDVQPLYCKAHASPVMTVFSDQASGQNSSDRGMEISIEWDHVTANPLFCRHDILAVDFQIGARASYFNALAREMESVIDPWGIKCVAKSESSERSVAASVKAPRHLAVNATTSFLNSLSTLTAMFTSRNPFIVQPSSYSRLNAYSSNLRALGQSRRLRVRNLLGIDVSIDIESVSALAQQRGARGLGKRKTRRLEGSGTRKDRDQGGSERFRCGKGESISYVTLPSLSVLRTSRLVLGVNGFVDIHGVLLDLLSGSQQIFQLRVAENAHEEDQDSASHSDSDEDDWSDQSSIGAIDAGPLFGVLPSPVAVVVSFKQSPSDHATTLDVIMELSTNISLLNNTRSDVLVDVHGDTYGVDDTTLESKSEIPLPLPLLMSGSLRVTEGSGSARDQPLVLLPSMFDSSTSTKQRHSQDVLERCYSIQFSKILSAPRIKAVKSERELVLWRLLVQPPYAIRNALPADVSVECAQGDTEPRLWSIKSGHVEDLMVDLDVDLTMRLIIGGRYSKKIVISASEHLRRRSLLRRGPQRPQGDDPAFPEVTMEFVWERESQPRILELFAEVWLLNRSGIALQYRAPYRKPRKDGAAAIRSAARVPGMTFPEVLKSMCQIQGSELSLPSDPRLRDDATYTSDFANLNVFGLDGKGCLPPLLLHCPALNLQLMPYCMAKDAISQDTLIVSAMSTHTGVVYRSTSYNAGQPNPKGGFPLYSDAVNLTFEPPSDIVPVGVARVHILMRQSESTLELKAEHEVDPSFISFTSNRDCFVFAAIKASAMTQLSQPPVWMRRMGFIRAHSDVIHPAQESPSTSGLIFFKRFFRCETQIWLGKVDALFVVRASDDASRQEVDISLVHMHHPPAGERVFASGTHCWTVLSDFAPMQPVYMDRDHYVITELPLNLLDKRLLLIQTSQEEKKDGHHDAASFTVMQDSVVLLCVDSRGRDPIPPWITRDGWYLERDQHIPGQDGKTLQYFYNIFSKKVSKGERVVVGGSRAHGKERAMFLLVHVSPSVASSDPIDPDECTQNASMQRHKFWEEDEVSMDQVPLQLDWRGRMWSLPFSIRSVLDVGVVSAGGATFGVSVKALPGIFHRTRAVTVYPRFVVFNKLSHPVRIVPSMEISDDSASHMSQPLRSPESGRWTRNGGPIITDTRGNQLCLSDRSPLCKVCASSCVAVYDFPEAFDTTQQSEILTLFRDTKPAAGERSIRFMSGLTDDTSEFPVSPPIFVERVGESSYCWLRQTRSRELLGKTLTELHSNQTTIFIHLDDVGTTPPMVIENRSSTNTLLYAVGQRNKFVRLDPLRWHAVIWEDERKEIRVCSEQSLTESAAAIHGRGSKEVRGFHSRLRTRKAPAKEERAVRGVQTYTLRAVGKLEDLKVPGSQPLAVRSARRRDRVETLVLSFREYPEGTADVSDDKTEDTDLDTSATVIPSAIDHVAAIVNALHQSYVDFACAGLSLSLAESSRSGTFELLTLTLDDIRIAKAQESDVGLLTVWHVQIDDMRPTAPSPVILQPADSGFNSHRSDNMVARPVFALQSDRDFEVSLMHDVRSYRSIGIAVADLNVSVFLDAFMDVQQIMMSSISWATLSEDEALAKGRGEVFLMLGDVLSLPADTEGQSVLFLQEFELALPTLNVEFHLGKKLLSFLSGGPGGEDDDDDVNEEGFMSTSAILGGAMTEIILSLGDTVANANPTFRFESVRTENYFGSQSSLISMLALGITRQTVTQVYQIVGHIDLLGDPLSLCKSYASGVTNFVVKSSKGHAASGARDLVKGVVGGTAGSVSKITGAMQNLISGFESTTVADEPLLAKLHLGESRTDRGSVHLGTGFSRGARHFGRSVAKGVTGVVVQPYQGAVSGGGSGFARGVGKGVVGLAAGPISGVLAAAHHITGGIEATTGMFEAPRMGRRRKPREPEASKSVLTTLEPVDLDVSIPDVYRTLNDGTGNNAFEVHAAVIGDAVDHSAFLMKHPSGRASDSDDDLDDVDDSGTTEKRSKRRKSSIFFVAGLQKVGRTFRRSSA